MSANKGIILPEGSKLLLSPEQIRQRIERMGRELSEAMRENPPWLVIGVLRGAFIFMADLVRSLQVPVLVDFIQISSYGCHTASSGQVELLSAPRMEIAGRRLLLVDDILDTGNSILWLINYFNGQGAAAVQTCVLLDKPACRKAKVRADYVGFTLPPAFVVGYGLDMAQDYRQLPGIYQLPEDESIC